VSDEPRLKSEIWVMAYVRRCNGSGAAAFVTRKGDVDAGSILVVVDRLDGSSRLYGRARNAEARLVFMPLTDWADAATIQTAIDKQTRVDSDLWIVAVENRSGEAWLEEYDA
jgi:hypothetical protein